MPGLHDLLPEALHQHVHVRQGQGMNRAERRRLAKIMHPDAFKLMPDGSMLGADGKPLPERELTKAEKKKNAALARKHGTGLWTR